MVLNIGNQVDHAPRFVGRVRVSNDPGPKNMTIEDAPLRGREMMTITIVGKELPTAFVVEIAG